MIFVDFETRSSIDIAVHGGRRYAEDESTEVLCGAAIDATCSPARVHAWAPFVVPLSDWQVPGDVLAQLDLANVEYAEPVLGSPFPPEPVLQHPGPFVAHNADGFDAIIWRELGLPPKPWIDTIHLVRRRGLAAALDHLGAALFGLGKDTAGRQVLRVSCKPQRHGQFLDPDGARLSILLRYCIQDCLLMAAAWYAEGLGETHPDDRVLEVSRQINERGIAIDIPAAEALHLAYLAAVEEAKSRARAVCPWNLTQVAKLLQWLESRGVPLPNLQRATVRDVLRRPRLPEGVRTVLEARRGTVGVAGGKVSAVLSRVSPDGRLRDALTYHAAVTGRWAGRGFQPQNLPRPISGLEDYAIDDVYAEPDLAPAVARDLEVSILDVLGSLLRGVMIAPPGKFLAQIDFAQIEARGLLWLADDEDGLAPYRAGDDPYVAAADAIGPGTPRSVGKICVLLLGYQGGPMAFLRGCAAQDVSPRNLDVEAIVDAWRDSRPKVAGVRSGAWTADDGRRIVVRRGGLWRELHFGVRRVVQRDDKEAKIGRCHWTMRGPHLVCTLPSGRPMLYRHVRMEHVATRWGGTALAITYEAGQRGRVPTYGGCLAENITQAVCRDLLAAALVRVEQAGYPVVLHVHDEVVVEVEQEDSLPALLQLTQELPAWAAGLPVAAEGQVSRRFGA